MPFSDDNCAGPVKRLRGKANYQQAKRDGIAISCLMCCHPTSAEPNEVMVDIAIDSLKERATQETE
jgi:hypothetical protein